MIYKFLTLFYMKTQILITSMAALMLLTACGPDAQVVVETEKAQVMNIASTITATGTIEPVTSVTVGTQVSGIIDHLYADFNSVVKKGQVIAELDRTNLISTLESAQSNLANAESTLNYQRNNFKRMKDLYEKGLIAADEYEQASLALTQAQQQVSMQQQSVQQARTNLGYATITAPIDGIVLNRAVEEGQTVAAMMTTPELFTIAQDLTDMRVIADIDEADIGGVKEGQKVIFMVDAYPDDVFEGEVTQVRQEATTQSNVVTYEVVIAAPNPDLKLKPGLTANITITTDERSGVVAVPLSALHFTPNPDLLKEDESIADTETQQKVWVFDGKTFKALAVTTGITNGSHSEITSGLQAGTEVVISQRMEGGPQGASGSPFMPKMNKKK